MKRRHAGVLVLLAVVALLMSGHARPALTDAAWNDQAYARSDFGTGRWAYAEASAQLIEAEALSLDVAQAIRTQAEYPDSPGAYRADIDADVLAGLVGVEIEQVGLPLIADGQGSGLVDLGEAAGAGALSGYASAPSWDEAAAASGAVTSAGALDLSAGVDRESPMARVELTSLLGQLNVAGLSQAVVDEVGLALGALGSRATGHIDGEPAGEYLLSGAELTVSSPTLAGLVGQIDAELAEVATTLNNSLGPDGPVQGALNVLNLPRLNVLGLARVDLGTPVLNAEVDLSAASDHLSAAPLTSSDGLLSVDLATGRMSVDLAQLVEGDELNGLAPNTEILTDDNIARITSALTDLLAQTVGSVTEAANDVLESTALTVTIDGEIGLLLGLITTDLDVTVDTTISDVLEGTTGREDISVDADLNLLGVGISEDDVLDALLSPVLDDVLPALVTPLTTVLDDGGRLVTDAVSGVVGSTTQLLSPVLDGVLQQLLTMTVNGQDRPGTLGEGSFTVAALRLGLLPGLTGQPLATVSLASSSVRVVR